MQRVTRHNRVTQMPLSLVFLSFVKAGEDKTLVEKKGLRFSNSNRGAKTEAKNKGKNDRDASLWAQLRRQHWEEQQKNTR